MGSFLGGVQIKLQKTDVITYAGEVTEKCDSDGFCAILIREEEEDKGTCGKTNDFSERFSGPYGNRWEIR